VGYFLFEMFVFWDKLNLVQNVRGWAGLVMGLFLKGSTKFNINLKSCYCGWNLV